MEIQFSLRVLLVPCSLRCQEWVAAVAAIFLGYPCDVDGFLTITVQERLFWDNVAVPQPMNTIATSSFPLSNTDNQVACSKSNFLNVCSEYPVDTANNDVVAVVPPLNLGSICDLDGVLPIAVQQRLLHEAVAVRQLI